MMFPLNHGVMAAGGIVLPENYEEMVLRDSPVAYWRLGESTGASMGADTSGNGNNLTYETGVFFEQPGAIANDPNTAISFDSGVSRDRAYITNAEFENFPRETLSIEFWVNLSEIGKSIITKGQSRLGAREIDIFTRNVSGDPSITFGANDNNLFEVNAPAPMLNSGYHHIVASWDGTTGSENPQGVKIYIDGGLAGSGNAFALTNISDYGTKLFVGGDGTYRGNDPVDEVAIYDYELSAQQVLDHYNMARGGGDEQPVELEPNTQYVLSNNNLTATNNGTTSRGVCVASQARSSGLYYYEVEVVDPGLGSNSNSVGVVPESNQSEIDAGVSVGGSSDFGGGYMYNGASYIKGSYSNGYGPSFGAGDVIGVLCDIDGGSLRFSKNGVLQPVIAFDFTTDGGAWLPAFNTSYDSGSGTPSEHNARFTPGSLEYLPEGYKAWAETEPEPLPISDMTMNPADKNADIVLSDGDLVVTKAPSGAYWASVRGLYGRSAGKYYAEFFFAVRSTADEDGGIGIATENANLGIFSDTVNGYLFRTNNGLANHNNSEQDYILGGINEGDIIGLLVDLDEGTVEATKNGVAQGPVWWGNIDTTKTWFPAAMIEDDPGAVIECRFSEADWTYTPPAGFGMWQSGGAS